MTAATKDLTRDEALKLAREKWGSMAWVGYGMINGYRVGWRQMAGNYPGAGMRVTAGHSVQGWREACERAGLLSWESAR